MKELSVKQERLLVRLARLSESIASGTATSRQIEQALALEVEIPWPHMHIGSLIKQSASLSKAEAALRKLTRMRKSMNNTSRGPG